MSPVEIAILIGLAGVVAGTAAAGAARPSRRPVPVRAQDRKPRGNRR